MFALSTYKARGASSLQMTNYYKDRTESAIYGSRLLIFKRIDLKSDSWWFRATIDGHKGYVRRSCKTSNKEIALNYATQKYEELRFKKSNNQSLAELTFGEFFTAYMKRGIERQRWTARRI